MAPPRANLSATLTASAGVASHQIQSWFGNDKYLNSRLGLICRDRTSIELNLPLNRSSTHWQCTDARLK